jgi:hypothetical protein
MNVSGDLDICVNNVVMISIKASTGKVYITNAYNEHNIAYKTVDE